MQTFCGVSLPKTESLTDWSRRPLTDKQIEYAIDDVKYLIVAYTEMMSRLRELGRVDWVLDELRPLADESHYRADRHEAFRKVKRINSCSRHQLGIARELAAWREDRAERRNIPRKWVMSDDTLLALVKRNPVRVEEFRSIRGTDQLGARRGRCAHGHQARRELPARSPAAHGARTPSDLAGAGERDGPDVCAHPPGCRALGRGDLGHCLAR